MGVDNPSLTVNSLSLNQGTVCLHKPISVLSLRATASITAVAWKGKYPEYSCLGSSHWEKCRGIYEAIHGQGKPFPWAWDPFCLSLCTHPFSESPAPWQSKAHWGLSPDALRFSSFPSFLGNQGIPLGIPHTDEKHPAIEHSSLVLTLHS